MRYRGTLEPDATRGGGGLPVVLDISDRRLVVRTGDELLGEYPLSEVAAERRGSDRFDLHIGGEQLLFRADDAIQFSYEAMPLLATQSTDNPSQVLTRVRSWWRDRTDVPEDPVRHTDPDPVEGLPVPPPARNPDFVAEPNGLSLTDLRRRFGTERVADLHDRAVEPEPIDARVDDFGSEERVPPKDHGGAHASQPAPAPSVEAATPDGPAAVRREPRPAAVRPQVAPSEDQPIRPEQPPETNGLAAVTCAGLRSDGTRCGSAVVSERGFCFAHDPDRADERRRVEQETTAAARRVRRSGRDMTEVLDRLERAVIEVHEGRLDPSQAMAMASLTQAMIDTLGVASGSEKPATS